MIALAPQSISYALYLVLAVGWLTLLVAVIASRGAAEQPPRDEDDRMGWP